MPEKQFQTKFNHWIKNIYKKTACFELKVANHNSMPFSAVADHQVDALWNAKHGILVFKIPDSGFQNPFDCFSLVGVPAYIVIKYATGMVYLIDIDEFVRMSKSSIVRSISEKRANEVAEIKFNIRN